MPVDKKTKIIGAVLFLSLAGNIFLGGHMLGDQYRQGSGMFGDCARSAEWKKKDKMLRDKLPPLDLQLMEQSRELNRGKFKLAKDKMEAARQAVDAAVHADPFDQSALDRALQDEKLLKEEFFRNMRASKEELVSRMSPEGQRVMKEVGQRFRDGMEKRRGPRGEGPAEGGFMKRFGGDKQVLPAADAPPPQGDEEAPEDAADYGLPPPPAPTTPEGMPVMPPMPEPPR